MNELENGLIVSCYADWSINPYMDDDTAIACVARSCLSGGARAIRTNLDHVRAVRDAIEAPLIGIKKVYRQGKDDPTDFRITPTMKEVDALVLAGAPSTERCATATMIRRWMSSSVRLKRSILISF